MLYRLFRMIATPSTVYRQTIVTLFNHLITTSLMLTKYILICDFMAHPECLTVGSVANHSIRTTIRITTKIVGQQNHVKKNKSNDRSVNTNLEYDRAADQSDHQVVELMLFAQLKTILELTGVGGEQSHVQHPCHAMPTEWEGHQMTHSNTLSDGLLSGVDIGVQRVVRLVCGLKYRSEGQPMAEQSDERSVLYSVVNIWNLGLRVGLVFGETDRIVGRHRHHFD